MSNLPPEAFLIFQRGRVWENSAGITSLCFSPEGDTLAFGTGDGEVGFISSFFPALSAAVLSRQTVHPDGISLSLCPASEKSFLSGGDDGNIFRLTVGTGPAEAEITPFAAFPRKWIEQILAYHPGQKNGFFVILTGKEALITKADGTIRHRLPHPATVSALALDHKGKRLAAAYYGGVALWFTQAEEPTPQLLPWKGSHLNVIWHPQNEAVLTAMQENALHGWWLKKSKPEDIQMQGYPAKPTSLSFSPNGHWLATSGSEAAVLWPFTQGGPMGKEPLQLAAYDHLCELVAFHPEREILAVAYKDGMTLLTEPSSKRVIPVLPPAGHKVSALVWNKNGTILAVGTESGTLALLDLTQK